MNHFSYNLLSLPMKMNRSNTRTAMYPDVIRLGEKSTMNLITGIKDPGSRLRSSGHEWTPDSSNIHPEMQPELIREDVPVYTFYCKSEHWDNSVLLRDWYQCYRDGFGDTPDWNTLTEEERTKLDRKLTKKAYAATADLFLQKKKCIDSMPRKGNGTKENPWTNVVFALQELECLTTKWCGGYVRLLISGTVDYSIFVVKEYLQTVPLAIFPIYPRDVGEPDYALQDFVRRDTGTIRTKITDKDGKITAVYKSGLNASSNLLMDFSDANEIHPGGPLMIQVHAYVRNLNFSDPADVDRFAYYRDVVVLDGGDGCILDSCSFSLIFSKDASFESSLTETSPPFLMYNCKLNMSVSVTGKNDVEYYASSKRYTQVCRMELSCGGIDSRYAFGCKISITCTGDTGTVEHGYENTNISAITHAYILGLQCFCSVECSLKAKLVVSGGICCGSHVFGIIANRSFECTSDVTSINSSYIDSGSVLCWSQAHAYATPSLYTHFDKMYSIKCSGSANAEKSGTGFLNYAIASAFNSCKKWYVKSSSITASAKSEIGGTPSNNNQHDYYMGFYYGTFLDVGTINWGSRWLCAINAKGYEKFLLWNDKEKKVEKKSKSLNWK